MCTEVDILESKIRHSATVLSMAASTIEATGRLGTETIAQVEACEHLIRTQDSALRNLVADVQHKNERNMRVRAAASSTIVAGEHTRAGLVSQISTMESEVQTAAHGEQLLAAAHVDLRARMDHSLVLAKRVQSSAISGACSCSLSVIPVR